MSFDNLILIVPDAPDEERDAVADAWLAGEGEVLRLARFWDPPKTDPARVRLYGNDTFCLVLEQKLGVTLVSPPDDLLVGLTQEWTKRRIEVRTLEQALNGLFPCFVKPVVPKLFGAGVYDVTEELREETTGLEKATKVFVAEVVELAAEARAFVLDGSVLACAVYEGDAIMAEARQFASEFVRAHAELLPAACVVDIGLILGRGWCVVEANAAWGAGLNGCDPTAAAVCISHATTSTAATEAR